MVRQQAHLLGEDHLARPSLNPCLYLARRNMASLQVSSTAPIREPSRALISVIVPCYNVERYVERCIVSLLAQSHRAMEIIAVNDRSTDGTAMILDRLAGTDPRLIVLNAEVNGGPHAARALGVQHSNGDLIAFVDGDDHVLPTMFQSMLEALESTFSDIAICSVRMVDPAGGTLGHKVLFGSRQVIDRDVLGSFSRLEFGSGVLWNKLFRRDIVVPSALTSLSRSVDAGEDHIVCIGAFAEARRVVLMPEDHYLYLVRPESISNAPDATYAFAFLMGCYVTCLKVYADAGEAVLVAIDTLYMRQFRFDRYRLNDPTALLSHEKRLRKDLSELVLLRPHAAYALIHAFDTSGEPEPQLPLRYWLGQLRIALRKVGGAIVKCRS